MLSLIMQMDFGKRKIITVIICIVAAGIHLITGPNYKGPFPDFVNGHLIDIVLPFALYLLAYLPDNDWLRKPWVRVLLVTSIGFIVETSQYFGYPLFGSVFDPLDYAMYLLGAVLGVIFEKTVFEK